MLLTPVCFWQDIFQHSDTGFAFSKTLEEIKWTDGTLFLQDSLEHLLLLLKKAQEEQSLLYFAFPASLNQLGIFLKRESMSLKLKMERYSFLHLQLLSLCTELKDNLMQLRAHTEVSLEAFKSFTYSL